MKILTFLLSLFIFNSTIYAGPVEEINLIRKENGLRPLKVNAKLVRSATAKACDLQNRNYWSHYAPDGTTPWSFFVKEGYYYKTAGENLAQNYSMDIVVKKWMNSETHKTLILKKSYKEIGIGSCGKFIVAHFGST